MDCGLVAESAAQMSHIDIGCSRLEGAEAMTAAAEGWFVKDSLHIVAEHGLVACQNAFVVGCHRTDCWASVSAVQVFAGHKSLLL